MPTDETNGRSRTTIRTKGDLTGLTIRKETEYGKVSSTEQSEGLGQLITMETPDEVSYVEHTQCGTMEHGVKYPIAYGTGFTAKFNSWYGGVERLIGLATGEVAATDPAMESFTTRFNVSPTEPHYITGCRVDTLTIGAPNVGEPVEVTLKAVGRYHTLGQTPADADGVSFEMSGASCGSMIPLMHLTQWELRDDPSHQWVPIVGKGYTLTIERALMPVPGMASQSN